jgi:hypothetical protein
VQTSLGAHFGLPIFEQSGTFVGQVMIQSAGRAEVVVGNDLEDVRGA